MQLTSDKAHDSWPAVTTDGRRIVFVSERGGTLLLVAGKRHLPLAYQEADDPLVKMMPADLTPPRTPEGTAVTSTVSPLVS